MMMPAIARRHKQVPDALRFGAGFLFFNHLKHFPALAAGLLGLVIFMARADVGLDEIAHAVAPEDLFIVRLEIHSKFSRSAFGGADARDSMSPAI